MGHKSRLNQTEKRDRKEEPKYFKDIIEVLTIVEGSKIQVDEVEQFEDEWITTDLVTLPKFTAKIIKLSK